MSTAGRSASGSAARAPAAIARSQARSTAARARDRIGCGRFSAGAVVTWCGLLELVAEGVRDGAPMVAAEERATVGASNGPCRHQRSPAPRCWTAPETADPACGDLGTSVAFGSVTHCSDQYLCRHSAPYDPVAQRFIDQHLSTEAPIVLTHRVTTSHTSETGTRSPGLTPTLCLLGLAGLALDVGSVTPPPRHVRRRDRSG